MFKKTWPLAGLLFFLLIILSACSWNPFKKAAPVNNEPTQPIETPTNNNPSEDQSFTVKKFTSLDDLKKFLSANPGGSSNLMYGRGAEMMVKTMAPTNAMATDMALSSVPVAGSDYSTTNIQVAGVDEGDIIKSDGNYLYALVYNDLYIIKAQPASESQIISKITFKSRPQDLYVSGDRLVVFGADDQIYAAKIYDSFRRRSPYAFLKVFDLKDRKNPALVRDLEFEGSYVSSRLIGDYLYFITDNYSYYDVAEPLLPRVLDKGQVIPEKCDISGNRCYSPEVYYFNIPYDSYNFTSVTAVNIKDNNEAISGQTYLLNGTQNIYVSTNNIYITYTKYLDEYGLQQDIKRELIYDRLNQDDKDRIAKIEAVDNFILNANEKKSKIGQIIDAFINSLGSEEAKTFNDNWQTRMKQKYIDLARQLEQTYIYKIGVSGNKLEYKAMGQVNGQVLNQFSMDENKGYFRLATTKNRSWSNFQSEEQQQSYSNVYILDENLKVVSGLENLGTTERIYAARFMGDRAYVVTFRQTDPIYVIDLSKAEDPKILAALKIPGFSNYIHPYDENGNKLIGLGRDTEEDAGGNVKVKGVKLSLFDFTDLSKPKESSSYIIGNQFSDSIALFDHKAFLFSKSKNLLAIPVSLREEVTGAPSKLNFSGVLVFSINNDKFELKGRIDHSDGGQYNQSDYWGGFNYYDNSVKRALYINNDLYTFSNKFVMVNSLGSATGTEPLALVKKIEFSSPAEPVVPMPLSSPAAVGASSATSGAAN